MKMYTFKTSDGAIEVLNLQQASKLLNDPVIKSRFEEIILNLSNRKRSRDGFTSGWQENIQAYAGGPAEYSQMLKDRGLVEIGRDYIPTESRGNTNYCQTEEFVQDCLAQGIELSGNEQDAIKSGDYFKGDAVE
jgi:hypothetical protein